MYVVSKPSPVQTRITVSPSFATSLPEVQLPKHVGKTSNRMAPRKRTDASRQLSALPLTRFPPRIPDRHRRGGTPRLSSEPSAMPAGSAAAEFASIQTRRTPKRCSSSPFVLVRVTVGLPPVFCFRPKLFVCLHKPTGKIKLVPDFGGGGARGHTGRCRARRAEASYSFPDGERAEPSHPGCPGTASSFSLWDDSGPFLDRRCVSGPRAEKG